MKHRILVTGHLGFIGSVAFDYLKDEGFYVVGYDIKEHNNDYDIKDVIDLIEANNIDVVMHFGAMTSTIDTNLSKILKFNYDFTRELIEYCYDEDILLQISSSASVYGNENTTVSFKETDDINPKSYYAMSKVLCEREAMIYILCHGAKIQVFRYFNVYSGNQYEHSKKDQASPYYKFTNEYINDGKITLFKNSDSYKRDFINVLDVVSTQIKFFDIEEDGIWNIGKGKVLSFEDVAKNVLRGIKGNDIDYQSIINYIDMPEELKHHYQTYTCADLSKLNKTLSDKNV